MPKAHKIRSLHICAISPEKHWNEVDFFPGDKRKSFLKLIVSLWVCVVRHAQSIKNNKFAISLQYLNENIKDEADFMPAHER